MMHYLVSLIFAVLLGWPVLKLVATIIGRGRWDRQRRLRLELDSDPRYGVLERRVVAEMFQEGKGSFGQLALPFVALFGGLALVLAFPRREAIEASQRSQLVSVRKKLLQLEYPEATRTTFDLLHDERFVALSVGASELQMLRYPVATLVTALAIFPSLVLLAIFYGLKLSIRHVARRIVESSQQTVKTFATLITSATTAP